MPNKYTANDIVHDLKKNNLINGRMKRDVESKNKIDNKIRGKLKNKFFKGEYLLQGHIDKRKELGNILKLSEKTVKNKLGGECIFTEDDLGKLNKYFSKNSAGYQKKSDLTIGNYNQKNETSSDEESNQENSDNLDSDMEDEVELVNNQPQRTTPIIVQVVPVSPPVSNADIVTGPVTRSASKEKTNVETHVPITRSASKEKTNVGQAPITRFPRTQSNELVLSFMNELQNTNQRAKQNQQIEIPKTSYSYQTTNKS